MEHHQTPSEQTPRKEYLKILIVNRVDFFDPANHGIRNKMRSQLRACEDLGHEVAGVYVEDNKILVVDGSGKRSHGPSSASRYYLYHHIFYDFIETLLSEFQPKMVILRFHLFHLNFLNFLKTCQSRRVDTVLEFPTFPFQDEFTSMADRARLKFHSTLVKRVTNRVDYFFHYGSGDRIYGKPSLRLTNGVDVNHFEKLHIPKDREKCTLIAVGKWRYWHGIDRLIGPLADRIETNLRLLVVGSSPYLESLKTEQVANSLNIEFLGSLSGEELTAAFSQADLGVGALGLHRKNLWEASPLKHREYCARGLPFVYAAVDPDFSRCDFIQQYPADESLLNLDEIMEFCEAVKYISRERIREYATLHLRWEDRMQSVIGLLSGKVT